MKKFIGFLFFLALALVVVYGAYRILASPEQRAAIAAVEPQVREVERVVVVTPTEQLRVVIATPTPNPEWATPIAAPVVLASAGPVESNPESEAAASAGGNPADPAPKPANPENWLLEQRFEGPTCNPNNYLGWVEAPDGFEPTGGKVDHYDMVLKEGQVAVLWGSGVSVGANDYGRSLVVLAGEGRWAVVINDGAYRVGVDAWGFFPKFWERVLKCLYGGNWDVVGGSSTLR